MTCRLDPCGLLSEWLLLLLLLVVLHGGGMNTYLYLVAQ
jgi:hypothetical protein